MKRVIIYAVSALGLGAFALFVYFAWWMDRTARMYAPAYNYSSHAPLRLMEFYDYRCRFETDSFVNCIRESRKRGLLRDYSLDELRSDLTPPENARQFGYLIANEPGLYGQRDVPIFICKTALASVRVEKGDPPGENHFAGYAGRAPQKITPEEFKSLDQSLYVDLEVIIAELD